MPVPARDPTRLYQNQRFLGSHTITLVADPGTFTFANGDKVDVIAGGPAIPLWLGGSP